jgi:hypothetical protein
MRELSKGLPVLLLAVLVAGCGGDSPRDAATDGGRPAPAAGGQYLLTEEPPGARGVSAARKDARDGDEVVVVGRIGGEKKPWVEGRAAFWIVDLSVKPCPPEEGCPTPWDYCCEDRAELLKAMATVKFVDTEGRTVVKDARELLGLKELQTVVVRGRARRDAEGNLTVLASGVYCRPDARP